MREADLGETVLGNRYKIFDTFDFLYVRVPFHTLEQKKEFWCFLENVFDPLKPISRCYKDAKWSSKDGRFWSYEACSESIYETSDQNANSVDSEMFEDSKLLNGNDPRKRFVNNESTKKHEIPQISSNGKSCLFPFLYDNESYSACTLVDSDTGVPWCATGIDQDGFVVDNEWGECRENKKAVNMPTANPIGKELKNQKVRPTTKHVLERGLKESKEQKIRRNEKKKHSKTERKLKINLKKQITMLKPTVILKGKARQTNYPNQNQ